MKKMTKRVLAAASAAAMLAGLTACTPTEQSNTPSGNDDGGNDGKKFVVGICQIEQHPALDSATKGFREALESTLGEGNVEFVEQIANGNTETTSAIINGFVSQGVDLILANATPSLQAAAAGTDTIPIIGTSVTDYATALDIDDWTGTTGRNISGTSDLAPLAEQAAMIKEWFPDAKTVGLIFCTSEANSKYQVNVIEQELQTLGITAQRYSFTDSNDLAAVVQTACDNSDVLYVPTDNTAAKNANLIGNVVLPAKKPVIAGEQGICGGCGVATLSIDYYEIGYQAGMMAYDILANGKDISTMEVQFAPNVTKLYNASICEQLELTPPDGYTAMDEG